MTKNYRPTDHTFAICAYQESSYLEDCIQSVMQQSVKTNVIMVTSTPCPYIEQTAEKYHFPLYINTGKSGIAEDWNFAIEKASTSLVTITHQDDIYEKDFAKEVLHGVNQMKQPIIAFSDYGELRNDEWVLKNHLLNVKSTMLIPLRPKWAQQSRFVRRRILSFGSPICCPSVTYCKDNIPFTIFTRQYRSDVDWQAWEKLSRLTGAFVYLHKPLMYHRIHEESATTAIIADNDRTVEDFEMFQKFWPKPIARLLEYFYNKSENSNQLS